MRNRNSFNDRLGSRSCTRFDICHESEGSFSALMLMMIELMQATASLQPNGRDWIEAKRLKLHDDITRLFSEEIQEKELISAIDLMDLVTGSAWGRLSAETEAPPRRASR